MNFPITVLVPTSPIPSHPSTEILEETIGSIRKRLPNSEIIVMVDGVRAEQEDRKAAYAEYTRRLIWMAYHRWHNVLPVVYEQHLHQAVMTRHTLERVKTPVLLFVEHDTPLVGDIPWADLVKPILGLEANVIRLHHEASVLEPHKHLMIDDVPRLYDDAPLLRTVQWSQRPQLASVAFYESMLREFFGERSRTMIEDVMHGVVQEQWLHFGIKGWKKFKLFMYAPAGDMKRSIHTDGRGDDPKYGMTFAYDSGTVPFGAPNTRRDE